MNKKTAIKIAEDNIKYNKLTLTDKQQKQYINNIYYWGNRKEQDELAYEKLSKTYELEMKKVFKDTAKIIDDKLNDLYANYMTEGISLLELNKRLNQKQLNAFRESIKDYQEEFQDLEITDPKLKLMYARSYVSRLEMLKTNIEAELKILAAKEKRIIDRQLIEVATNSISNNNMEFKNRLDIDVSFERPGADNVKKVIMSDLQGKNFMQRVNVNNDDLVANISTILSRGFTLGWSNQKMASNLHHKLDISFRGALRIMRTESSRVSNTVNINFYKNSEVLEAYQFLATLDDRTSEICEEMYMRIIPLKEAQTGVNVPPLHPNCRSTVIPYFPPDEFDT